MKKRFVSLLLASTLVVAGCGGGDSKTDDEDVSFGDESLLPADRTTQPPAAAPEASAPTTAAGAAARSNTTTSLQPTRRAPVTAPTGPAPDDPGAAGPTETERGKGGTGSFAPSILRPKANGSIRIELLVQSGITPARQALDHVSGILRNASGKPVNVPAPITIPGGSKNWSSEELKQLADRFGKANDGGPEATLHVLYVRGRSADNANAAGTAMRGDVLVMYPEVVGRATVPGVSTETVETAVLTHEVGHLLGLVDIYLKTGREDREHPGHSSNKGSVMYWAVETTDIVTVFGQGGPPRNFDAADLADLANIKDGAAPGSKG